MEQQELPFQPRTDNMPRGDFKDQTIEELRAKLHASQREVERAKMWIEAGETRCNELAAEISNMDVKLNVQRETIQQLKKERDFYQGAKMEREKKYTQEEIQEIAESGLADELERLNEREAIQAEGAARSEILHTGLSQIPLSALRKIGSIFVEGQLKYGRDNWKKGAFNKPYQQERAEHALVHFLEYLHQESNDGSTPIQQLAKVAWFCVTQIDTLERESTEELMQ